jgi:hypothetical protein
MSKTPSKAGLVNADDFKLNLKATLDSTKSDNLFVNIKPDTTLRVRFLPAKGSLFFVTGQHFKLKDENDRTVAFANLELHGTEETGTTDYLDKLWKVLKSGDEYEQEVAELIKLSKRWTAQVLVAERDESGKWTYFGPKVLALSKTTAEKVAQILSNQEMVGDDFFCDVKNGQDLLISRTGSGFDTKYNVDRSGIKSDLDALFPEWREKYITNLKDVLGLRVVTPDEQKAAARRTFPRLDWEKLAAEHGV